MQVLISGAAGNLGKASTKLFLEAGHTVHALLLPEKESLDLDSPQLFKHEVNLLEEEDAKKLVSGIKECPDLAFLCAGGYASGDLEKTSPSDIDKMVRLNFLTAYNLIRPLWLRWQEEKIKGRLVVMAAQPAVEHSMGSGMIAYTLSKNMLVKFIAMLNQGKKSADQRAFAIAPDTIDTPANRKSMPEADFSEWVAPEHIARLVLHLGSEAGKPIAQEVFRLYGAG